ncbi:MAG: hypothetical protein QME81_11715 [bacterium]|nr:hypothetical protein [bacterium]
MPVATDQATVLEHLNVVEKEIENIHSAFKAQNVFISSLGNARLILKQPLLIQVMQDEGGYIAHYHDVEAVGFGDNVSEALNNLKENIVELYFDLKEDADNLGPLPQKWLIILKELIAEK